MKKYLVLIICFVCFISFVGCEKKEADTSIGETIIKDFSTTDFNGNIIDQQIISQNKVVMINVWGTFCGPCIEEMPVLSSLNEKYGEQKLQIIGIPIDVIDANGDIKSKQFEEAKKIMANTNAKNLQLIPTKQIYDDLLKDIESVPQTFFVNSDGKQIGPTYHGAKSEAEWDEIITQILSSI